MAVAIGREMDTVERGMTILATTASAAPFIGLFGTVWGIINSFTAIAAEKTAAMGPAPPALTRS
ncbi:MAG: MotA/TolQ/ExbB proton channel family protein [Alphaproteobacteria bacterium]